MNDMATGDKRLRLAGALIACAVLTGCGKAAPASSKETARAHELVNEEFAAMGPRTFGDTWRADAGESGNNMLCGTFEAGDAARPYVDERLYIYDPRGDFVLIDPVLETLTSGSTLVLGAKTQTHDILTELWDEACEPFRPTWYRSES